VEYEAVECKVVECEVAELTSLISIQYVIIICIEVTRSCPGEICQNLQNRQF
jgi:hypothetical protein